MTNTTLLLSIKQIKKMSTLIYVSISYSCFIKKIKPKFKIVFRSLVLYLLLILSDFFMSQILVRWCIILKIFILNPSFSISKILKETIICHKYSACNLRKKKENLLVILNVTNFLLFFLTFFLLRVIYPIKVL